MTATYPLMPISTEWFDVVPGPRCEPYQLQRDRACRGPGPCPDALRCGTQPEHTARARPHDPGRARRESAAGRGSRIGQRSLRPVHGRVTPVVQSGCGGNADPGPSDLARLAGRLDALPGTAQWFAIAHDPGERRVGRDSRGIE